MHERIVRRTVAPLLAALLALTVLVAPTFASPILFCQKDANGTVGTYTFPTDCGGGSWSTTYNNLRLVMQVADDSTNQQFQYIRIQFNGDTAANGTKYNWVRLNSDGLATTRYHAYGTSYGVVGAIPGRTAGFGNRAAASFEVEIPGAMNNAFNQVAISRGGVDGSTNMYDEIATTVWAPTTTQAITSVTLSTETGAHFISGSHFDIYIE